MGGGHVSRPDFGMPQPDPAHPLTEFYCLLQRALDREGVFALPALYAQFRAPARRIYADEAADFLTLLPDEEEGASRLLAPAQLQLLYSSLHVMPDGAPAALLLTEECTRTVYAVQLLPPFVWEAPAGRSGGAEPHPHHAGRGRDRRLPRRAGPPSRLRQGGQALAPPPPGRDLSL